MEKQWKTIDILDLRFNDLMEDKHLKAKLAQKFEQYREFIATFDPKIVRRAELRNHFAQIYHSNAIEGNSMSFRQTKMVLVRGIRIRGKSYQEHAEIYGMKAALVYLHRIVNSESSSQISDVPQKLEDRVIRIKIPGVFDHHQEKEAESAEIKVKKAAPGFVENELFGPEILELILQLHLYVKTFEDPVEAGTFRLWNAKVGSHNAPAPKEAIAEMNDFVLWLMHHQYMIVHKVEYNNNSWDLVFLLGVSAHFGLVNIHPFLDGNGRSSRLLMNYFFLKAGFPPIFIHKNHKRRYYQMLEHVQLMGDLRPFVRFISECAIETIDSILNPAFTIALKRCFVILIRQISHCFGRFCHCCQNNKSKQEMHAIKMHFKGMDLNLQKNLQTCSLLVKQFEPCFGPNDKSAGEQLFYNGIFFDAEHLSSATKIIIEMAQQQKSLHGDGMKTVLLLCNAILQESAILLDMGIPTRELASAYKTVALTVLDAAKEFVQAKDGKEFIHGAGAFELEMARKLDLMAMAQKQEQKHSASLIQALAFGAMARAIRRLPAILAENSREILDQKCVGNLRQLFPEFVFTDKVPKGLLSKLLWQETRCIVNNKFPNMKFCSPPRGVNPQTGQLELAENLNVFDLFDAKLSALNLAIDGAIKILDLDFTE